MEVTVTRSVANISDIRIIHLEKKNIFDCLFKTGIFDEQRPVSMNIWNGPLRENRIYRLMWFYFFLAGVFAFGAALTGFAFRSLRALPGVNLALVLAAIFNAFPV